MKENKELNGRIVRLWESKRYKTYSSLARAMHIKFPKIVERVVKRDKIRRGQVELHRLEVMAKAQLQAEENINANDSLNER